MKVTSWLNKILNTRSFGIDKPGNMQMEIIGIAALVYFLIYDIFSIIADFVPWFVFVQPASVIPVTLGLLFGPVAAIGSAIGVLLVQLVGDMNLGITFGMIGNFLLAYSAFILWRIFTGGRFADFNFKYLAIFWLVCLISSLISSLVIVSGYSWLNLPVSFTQVFFNNFFWPVALGLFFIKLIRKGLFDNFFNK